MVHQFDAIILAMKKIECFTLSGEALGEPVMGTETLSPMRCKSFFSKLNTEKQLSANIRIVALWGSLRILSNVHYLN